MKKAMDKLYSKLKINKKLFIFLSIIFIIAIITGAIFAVMLDKGDKTLVTNYLNDFINNLSKNKIDYISVLSDSLITNMLLIIGIWLLGISVIGIPIILFLFFSQAFIISFSIASILINFKVKGLLLALIETFPNNVLYFIILFILVSYALTLSIKLISTIINKKQIDFKIISNKYLTILIISVIGIVFCSLYETFAIPNIIKLIIPILK